MRKFGKARVVAADDDRAGLTHEAHELRERGTDVLERIVVIEMIRLDVRDDGDIRIEVEEGAVRFVRLGDEELSGAVAAVRVVTLDDAADKEARVEVHAVEHRGGHGRGRRLAVRAGDGDGGIATTELGEHLRARPDGDIELTGSDELRVRLGDGGRHDDDIGCDGVDRGRFMADVDIDPGAGKLANIARRLEVGTAHHTAALMQDERDAAHAGAADTDEMDAPRALGVLGICHDRAILCFEPMIQENDCSSNHRATQKSSISAEAA